MRNKKGKPLFQSFKLKTYNDLDVLAVLLGLRKVGANCTIDLEQGSHSHGKSGKVMEKYVVIEKSWKIYTISKLMKK